MKTFDGVPKLKIVARGVKFCGLASLIVAAMLLPGCTRMIQNSNLSEREGEVRRAAAELAAAKNDAQRAAAYAKRGDAYGEKSRYARAMKLIPDGEYNKEFDLAMDDYKQALTLDPENAEIYYGRGNTYYGRAALDMMYDRHATKYLVPAKADFAKAVEKNPKHVMALDMLGLSDASLGEWTDAIADFGKEVVLDPSRKFRLYDSYCNRGLGYNAQSKFDLAAADFNQAIANDTLSQGDPCECEAYNPLMAIYLNQTHENDKARALSAKALTKGKVIAPNYLEQLKAAGGSR